MIAKKNKVVLIAVIMIFVFTFIGCAKLMAQSRIEKNISEEKMWAYYMKILEESEINFSEYDSELMKSGAICGNSIAAEALKEYYKKFFEEKDYADWYVDENSLDNIYFEIADINHDETPEIILYDEQSSYPYAVFTYCKGNTIPLNVGGHGGEVIYFDEGDIIIGTSSVMGFSFVNVYRIKNGQIEKLASYSNNEGEVGYEQMDEFYEINGVETDQESFMDFISKNGMGDNRVVKKHTMHEFRDEVFINAANTYLEK